MATTRPRITVTLTDRQHALLRSISDTSRKSMSAFLGEMLEAMLPMLERMAVVGQKVRAFEQDQKDAFIRSVDKSQAAVEPLLMEALGQFDLFMGEMEDAAGIGGVGCERASARAALAAAEAPSTNRGAEQKRKNRCKPVTKRVLRVSKVDQKTSKRAT